jgi:pimeloyl-ACP methyl ester carboxylesterase
VTNGCDVSPLRQMPHAECTPFFFGAAERPLFGCYHEPQPQRRKSCGVVVCYPLGHEYINSHRALRQLAVRLARAGCPVLRFDYSGCGDSGADYEQAGISQWLADISLAIDEVRTRSSHGRVCLVGLRLGGALSMTIGAERGDVDGLVLWDPVVDGKAYVTELTTLHQQRTRPLRRRAKWAAGSNGPVEILGFPLAHSTVADLERINLLPIQRMPAKHILLVATGEDGSTKALAAYLARTCVHTEYRHLPGHGVWTSESEGALRVPNEVLQSIISWIPSIHK